MTKLTDDDKDILVALHNGDEVEFQRSTGCYEFSIRFRETGIIHVPKRQSTALWRVSSAARLGTRDVVVMPHESDWVEFKDKKIAEYAYRSPAVVKPEAAAAIADIAAAFKATPLSKPEIRALGDAGNFGIATSCGDGRFCVEWYSSCGPDRRNHRRKVVYVLCLRGLLLASSDDGRLIPSDAGRAWLDENANKLSSPAK